MFRNTSRSYGWIAIALHWLMALAVFGMFGLGLYMVELTYYDAWYHGSLATHKAIGILVALAFVARLLWRVVNPRPGGLATRALENRAAHLVHWVLYGLLAAIFVSGYLISTADGREIEVFGLFGVPATLTGEHQEDIAGEVHEILVWVTMTLVVLHALAALKHHFISRNSTLKRMFRPGL
ncbi:cytochrome b [Parahaliea maris]|uniref:Cytochrome b n=1 Tax=Parahaliea maris TaxID=2716870 RepID=A0A5C9A767_9GAMM|nr:cytochrome b [Parahaliea maris]TXS95949.1 cytochrome b [Parahaliea maris]